MGGLDWVGADWGDAGGAGLLGAIYVCVAKVWGF